MAIFFFSRNCYQYGLKLVYFMIWSVWIFEFDHSALRLSEYDFKHCPLILQQMIEITAHPQVCMMESNPPFYFVRLTFWFLLDKIAS